MTIKEAREKAGLTQRDLAKKINVLQPNIADWETGKKHPKISSLEKISNACKVPLEELLPNHNRRMLKARVKSGFYNYPQTCEAIFNQISAKLKNSCTSDQLAEIARAIDSAYQSGRRSMGAEVVDGSFVWISCLSRGFELDELRKIPQKAP